MAPAIAFAPKHFCINFPLCTSSQSQKTVSEPSTARKGTRELYCSTCLDAVPCSFAGCDRSSAPLVVRGRSIQHCSEHYRDPSTAAARDWKLCTNSKFGCRHLAESRRGGKCFACAAGNLPCLHAMLGCERHVRGETNAPPRKRLACSDRSHHRCNYAPHNPAACVTARCGNLRSNHAQDTCAECAAAIILLHIARKP